MRITRPNQVWDADITCLPMNRGSLYLAAVMDWHSRYVVAWRLSNTLDAGFCAEALSAGPGQGQPEVFNTGQGSKFTSLEFTRILQDRGVRISMDGKGRYSGNIFVKRLWRTVQYEEVYLKASASDLEAQLGLEDYLRVLQRDQAASGPGLPDPGRGLPRGPGCCSRGVWGSLGESDGRRCSPGEGTESLAGEPGFSLNPTLVLSQ